MIVEKKHFAPQFTRKTMALSVLGLLLAGCTPTYVRVDCSVTCAPPPVAIQHCYEVPHGYVLSQDKYDPGFVPCPPRPAHPVPAVAGSGGDSGSYHGGTGGGGHHGGGPHEPHDPEPEYEASNTVAGEGASAVQGRRGDDDYERSLTGGGRGASATEDGVTTGVDAGGRW